MTDDSQGGLRGDQGVQTGQGVGTRDPQSSPPDFVGEGRALIAQWRAKAKSLDWVHATMGIGYKACATELEALLTGSGVQEWQPIETAPKDGTCVLGLVEDGEIIKVAFLVEEGIWVGDDDGVAERPTLWIPIPPVPKP